MLPQAGHHGMRLRRSATSAALFLSVVLAVFAPTAARGQIDLPASQLATQLPEPILWKQNRFLIPYQWSPTANQSTPHSVRLFISKDQGRTWQPISEAQPHLRGFTYHAEEDGEFWFSIRTIDDLGRAWPNEPHRPELRVIVDTTFPQIDELGGTLGPDGVLDIYWTASDARLNAAATTIQVQSEGSTTWQPVSLPPQQVAANGTSRNRAQCQLPAGTAKVLLSAEVYDRAGNRSFRGAEVRLDATGRSGGNRYPTMVIDRSDLSPATPPTGQAGLADPFASRPAASAASPAATVAGQGWQPAPSGSLTNRGPAPVTPQPWPADATSSGAWNGSSSGSPAVASGGSVSYAPPTQSQLEIRATAAPQNSTIQVAPPQQPAPSFNPVEPYRQNRLESGGRRTEDVGATSTAQFSSLKPQNSSLQSPASGLTSSFSRVELPPGAQPMMVGQRTFDLDYALDEVGRWGVSRVELWGTRDGGRAWRNYAFDDDNRSPIRVTVEGEGLYGFRIVAQSPGGPPPTIPNAGDVPELWVGVDLQQPRAELLSVDQGVGNLSDHLVIRWRAEDTNLDRHPIALFYSSRAGGPWTAVATGLENTGEYAWRLERHLPSQFYLRLEARDTAGNLGAYQTAQPVVLNQAQPAAHLRGVHPPGSAAQ